MNIIDKTSWGIITARGGSKSIPLKNLVPVCGRPLIEYSINAAKKAQTLSRIICSTDYPKIAEFAESCGVDVLYRPENLSGDLVPSVDVMIYVAEEIERKEGAVAEILILLQPTSLFVTSTQIDKAVNALLENPDANSSQNVVRVPHQFHAHNQRVVYDDGNDIAFVYEKEREMGYSKQTKPVYYTYGNLIVMRTISLIKERTMFGRPSIPVVVPLYTAYDLDCLDDIEMAELMIKNNLVQIG
jgi:CMP-N-acetylneuraminic acid synthetase